MVCGSYSNHSILCLRDPPGGQGLFSATYGLCPAFKTKKPSAGGFFRPFSVLRANVIWVLHFAPFIYSTYIVFVYSSGFWLYCGSIGTPGGILISFGAFCGFFWKIRSKKASFSLFFGLAGTNIDRAQKTVFGVSNKKLCLEGHPQNTVNCVWGTPFFYGYLTPLLST